METVPYVFTSLLKGMVKDTDEQVDEGVPRVRSGNVPSAGALSLWSGGVAHSR